MKKDETPKKEREEKEKTATKESEKEELAEEKPQNTQQETKLSEELTPLSDIKDAVASSDSEEKKDEKNPPVESTEETKTNIEEQSTSGISEKPLTTPIENATVNEQKPSAPEMTPIDSSVTSNTTSEPASVGEQPERNPDKKYAESYPLADEIERNALRKSGGGFFSSLVSFKNKRIKLLIGVIAIILLVVLGVGTFMNNRNQPLLFFGGNEAAPVESISPTPLPPSPSPTVAEASKSELQLQVLNGSGEAGVAGTAKDLLVENGYSDDIDTGNADNYDYTQTVIQVKEGQEDIAAMVREDLENDYTIARETETLPEDSEYDVVIIIGQE